MPAPGKEKQQKTSRATAGFVVLLISMVLLLYGMDVEKHLSLGGTPDLTSVEVREYQGEQLSSYRDFHENTIHGPQYIDIDSYNLTVTGLVNTPLLYSYSDLLTRFPHYRKVVTLYCVEGWDVTILWDGILLWDVLDEAMVDPRANTVIFYAQDGYSSSLPLNYIRDRDILLAYGMNNLTLPPERGFPFQVVAEDKFGYKWVKWVTKIEVSDDPQYRGYWERRGFAIDGNLSQPYLAGWT
ncbi:MAG: molybdopterin-dependent oxidoreductase [Methanomicrobiales archaeon]|nr:molybdopterin-dependent oxidoreductase [Methanomicrobiales archaeon]